MNQHHYKAAVSATGEGIVTALVSTYDVDKDGDAIQPGAFASSIARLKTKGGTLPILTAHDWANPNAIVGFARPEDICETPEGLVVKFQLDLDNPTGLAVWKAVKNGSLREFSIGFTAPVVKRVNGVNEITDLDLVEVSVCHRGVNANTRVLATKAQAGPATPPAPRDLTSRATGDLTKAVTDLSVYLKAGTHDPIGLLARDWVLGRVALQTVSAETGERKALLFADSLQSRALDRGEVTVYDVIERARPMAKAALDGIKRDAARREKVAAIERRRKAEAQVKALMEAEGIVDPAVAEAEQARLAEERRRQHEMLQARQAQTAQAMRSGALDEVIISPTGAIKAGPIRAAQEAAEIERLKARQAEAREQRERERERAEKVASEARRNGPGVGGHKVGRVDG